MRLKLWCIDKVYQVLLYPYKAVMIVGFGLLYFTLCIVTETHGFIHAQLQGILFTTTQSLQQ